MVPLRSERAVLQWRSTVPFLAAAVRVLFDRFVHPEEPFVAAAVVAVVAAAAEVGPLPSAAVAVAAAAVVVVAAAAAPPTGLSVGSREGVPISAADQQSSPGSWASAAWVRSVDSVQSSEDRELVKVPRRS